MLQLSSFPASCLKRHNSASALRALVSRHYSNKHHHHHSITPTFVSLRGLSIQINVFSLSLPRSLLCFCLSGLLPMNAARVCFSFLIPRSGSLVRHATVDRGKRLVSVLRPRLARGPSHRPTTPVASARHWHPTTQTRPHNRQRDGLPAKLP